MRRRSIEAEIRHAKHDVLRTTTLSKAKAAIDDHRHGLHARPGNHTKNCYACLAWCRRERKEQI